MIPGYDKDAPFAPEGSHEQAVAEKLSGTFGDRRPDGGPCCEARYAAGVKDGPGRMFHGSGKVYAVETWKNGELQGPTWLYYESGVLQAELVYKDGVLDGVCREYFEDGQLESETTWAGGKREGPCTEYGRDGSIARSLTYRDDVPQP
jgi:antitoxin component YwqK of YwqJK toxin-antitoxin module